MTLNAVNGGYGNRLVVHQGTVLVPAGKSVRRRVEIASGPPWTAMAVRSAVASRTRAATAVGAPGAPTKVVASAGFKNATLSFTPGAANCYPLNYPESGGGLSWSVNSSPETSAA